MIGGSNGKFVTCNLYVIYDGKKEQKKKTFMAMWLPQDETSERAINKSINCKRCIPWSCVDKWSTQIEIQMEQFNLFLKGSAPFKKIKVKPKKPIWNAFEHLQKQSTACWITNPCQSIIHAILTSPSGNTLLYCSDQTGGSYRPSAILTFTMLYNYLRPHTLESFSRLRADCFK